MNNNSSDNNNSNKDSTNQIHSSEPSINILSKLNSIANENFHQIIPSIVCEICYKADNLKICEICKNGYHQKCLGTAFLPDHFICLNCKKQFTEDEITSIINNPYNQRQRIFDNQKAYKEYEHNKKVKKQYHINTFTHKTKIIELDEDKNEDNDKDSEDNNDGNKVKDGNGKLTQDKKKIKKKDINLGEIINENNLNLSPDKNESKSTKKENRNKIKIDFDRSSRGGGWGGDDMCESSLMSKSQEIQLDKNIIKPKKRKKDKDREKDKERDKERDNYKDRDKDKEKDKDKEINASIKNKINLNHNHNINHSQNNNNISKNNTNNNNIKSNKEKDKNSIKEELSLYPTQSQSSKKSTKKKNNDSKNEKEQNLLLSLTHTDPQYKRRKIKLGVNRQCNMYEFTDKYENKINFEEEEYERNDLIQVWSKERNPLSEEELNNYMKTAKLFWNYRNIHIEEDLCTDFFQECEQKMKNKKISLKLKNKITKLIKELKEMIKTGINLNSHYDEMSLRILHLCKYKTNVALLFLYKGLNPFIEEVEEGFKHDIYFFQDEIYSFINSGDLFDSDS